MSYYLVPTKVVQNLTAFNESSTSLAFHWSPLSSQPGQSGILGYVVTYEGLLWPGNAKSNESRHLATFMNATRGRLTQLKKYTWYGVRIAAMNRRGVGIPSSRLLVLTDEDGEWKHT